MAKGRKTGGRTAGTPNKVTANVRAILTEAFEKHGGVAALNKWAQANETEFYRIWSKLVPTEVTGEGGGSLVIRVVRE